MPSLPSSRLSQSAFRPQRPKATLFPLKNWPADPKIANKLNQHLSILKTTVMKKLIFPAVAALALGLASCSSDEVNPGNGGQPSFAQGGYAKVAINLPSRSGSNRGANDSFEDGLAKEYHVKDAKLVLFQGTSETNATFHSAYKLNVSMENGDKPQITTTTRIVQKLTDESTGKPLSGSRLFALVVLNDNGLLNVSDDNKSLTVNGTNMDGLGLSDLQNLEVKRTTSTLDANGILMTNAPLAMAIGGTTLPTGNIQTLVEFSDAIYKTEAEAQKNTATDIYVERAVAKVTMNKTTGTSFLTKNSGSTPDSKSDVHFVGKTNEDIHWAVVGWDLDVTNNNTNFVRNTTTKMATSGETWNKLKSENVANYRFVGSSPVKTGVTLYRTYWAEDRNYNSVFDGNGFTYLPTSYSGFSSEFGDDNPKYCFENTFSVDHQKKQETTRVMLKVQLTDETNSVATFYTFNGDNSRLYKLDDRNKRIKEAVLNQPNVAAWIKTKGVTSPTINLVDLTFEKTSTGSEKRDADKGTVILKDFKVTIGTDTYTKADLKTDLGDTSTGELANDKLAKELSLGDIVEYVDGLVYYPVRIKHFGKELTPWNEEGNAPSVKPIPGSGIAQIYGSADPDKTNNFLGRYGVLRNNWYDIAVDRISAIGSPVVPQVKDDDSADDDLYNYISVRINILSWAKRTQHEDL